MIRAHHTLTPFVPAQRAGADHRGLIMTGSAMPPLTALCAKLAAPETLLGMLERMTANNFNHRQPSDFRP